MDNDYQITMNKGSPAVMLCWLSDINAEGKNNEVTKQTKNRDYL